MAYGLLLTGVWCVQVNLFELLVLGTGRGAIASPCAVTSHFSLARTLCTHNLFKFNAVTPAKQANVAAEHQWIGLPWSIMVDYSQSWSTTVGLELGFGLMISDA